MQSVIDAVEKNKKLMLEAERYIWANPETGYREVKTSEYMAKKFRELGYELTMAEGITGFYTVIDTGREGPEILVMGELDSVICPSHPDADPVTGAVHACGHHAQCAALLGVAAALKEKGALDGLCGRIRLCAVPAEELLEIEYRSQLREQGVIRYYGGKSEFLFRGYFDGVDLAMMIHHSSAGNMINRGSVGCMAKQVIYKGRAAHAGGSPDKGINALYAANCGLNAVNALRETFREADMIRVHPIITAGGAMVNAIPETVRMESYVRGAEYEPILATNRKVNRALVGAALSLGANVEIIDSPGYAPHRNHPMLMELAEEAFHAVLPEESLERKESISTGSSDIGDLSQVMPVIHPYCGGVEGRGHGNDYRVVDPERACVDSAKWQVAMIRMLLESDAERTKAILEGYTPNFSNVKEFLEYVESIYDSGDRIEYTEDGANVRL